MTTHVSGVEVRPPHWHELHDWYWFKYLPAMEAGQPVPPLRPADVKACPVPAEPVPDNNYVQPVPDHCDRIVWRNHYYHLPIKPAAGVAPSEVPSRENDRG